jgi:hypothetical protein
MAGIIKELRAERRCHSHGVRPVDLDDLLDCERRWGVPQPTGRELARVVRLKTRVSALPGCNGTAARLFAT